MQRPDVRQSTAMSRFVALLLDCVQAWCENVTPGPCQAEVAYPQVARRVEQQVAGLQVAMQHVCCVHVLQAPQNLHAGTPQRQPGAPHNQRFCRSALRPAQCAIVTW